MSILRKHSLSSIEFWLLVLMTVALPLSEAGKHIFALLFFFTWVVNRVQGNNWQFKLGYWDYVLGIFLFSCFLSTLFAFELGREWGAFADIFAGVLLVWMLFHSAFSDRQLYILLGGVIVSTFLGTLQGIWFWLITRENVYFELKSVGFTNQSAMYMAMVSAFVSWALIVLYGKVRLWLWMVLLFVFFVLAGVVFWGESRGAMLAFTLTMIIMVYFYGYCKRIGVKYWLISSGLMLLVSVTFLSLNPYLINKTLEELSNHNLGADRGFIAEISLEALKQNPVFGVGIDNQKKIDYKKMSQWTGVDEELSKQHYSKQYHPHNLYLGTLSERGVVGFLSLMLLLVSWTFLSLRIGLREAVTVSDWLVWGFGVSVLLVTLFAGFFNTPLRQENGRLAFLGLGLILSFFVGNSRGVNENSVHS